MSHARGSGSGGTQGPHFTVSPSRRLRSCRRYSAATSGDGASALALAGPASPPLRAAATSLSRRRCFSWSDSATLKSNASLRSANISPARTVCQLDTEASTGVDIKCFCPALNASRANSNIA